MKTLNLSYFTSKDILFPLLRKHDFGIEITQFINREMLFNYKHYTPEVILELKGIHPIALHGPFKNLSACSSDKNIREETFIQYDLIYQIAHELGAKDIVLHTGYDPMQDNFEEALGNSVWFWRRFLQNKIDVSFYLENVMEKDHEFLLKLHDRIDQSNFKICLDIGHVNKNSKHALSDWIKQLNKRIGYVHLHNNYGVNDDHNGIDNGNIDIKRTLNSLLQYAPEAVWSLETEALDRSIEWLKENGY